MQISWCAASSAVPTDADITLVLESSSVTGEWRPRPHHELPTQIRYEKDGYAVTPTVAQAAIARTPEGFEASVFHTWLTYQGAARLLNRIGRPLDWTGRCLLGIHERRRRVAGKRVRGDTCYGAHPRPRAARVRRSAAALRRRPERYLRPVWPGLCEVAIDLDRR